MEEVDGTIIRQLRELDCSLDEDKKTLRQLDEVEVMQCVMRCLSFILPQRDLPASPRSNANMASKYNVANFIASTCKELGFRGDLGYQSLLYGSESDVRNVLLFLIEKLPKEPTPVGLGGRREVTMATRFAMSPEINDVWLPPMDTSVGRQVVKGVPVAAILNAKSILMNRIAPNKRHYYDHFARIPFHDIYSILSSSYHSQQQPTQHLVSSAKLLALLPLLASTTTAALVHQPETMSHEAIRAAVPQERVISDADQRQEERDGEKKEEGVDAEAEAVTAAAAAASAAAAAEEVLSRLEAEAQHVRCALQSGKQAIDESRQRIGDLESCLRDEQAKLLQAKSRNLTLEQLEELQGKAEEDLKDLKGKWQEMRMQLHQQLQQMKGTSACQSEQYQRQIVETKERIRVKRREIEGRSETLRQLQQQMPAQQPPTRHWYTKRVLEVIANIKKQDAESRKLMSEVRGLQKEISALTGKVARCFSLSDEAVFAQAKGDEFGRRAYKLLACMHQESSRLSHLTTTTGLLRREILRLEESLQKQQALDIERKLAKISQDYSQVKQSNKELMLQLQQHQQQQQPQQRQQEGQE